MSFLTITIAVLAVGAAPEATAVPPDAEVRQSVQRGLSFLEKGGIAWQEKRKCSACHHVPMLLWSHHEARRKGFVLNAKVLDEVEPLALKPYLDNPRAKTDAAGKYTEQKNTPDPELVYLLASAGAEAAVPTEALPNLERCLRLLMETQEANGSWSLKNWSAPKRSPIFETDEVYTLWVLLALGAADKTALPKAMVSGSRERALAWLASTPSKGTVQALALRLVVEARHGKAEGVAPLVSKLVAQQHPDGGWSYGKDGTSDAAATGQALYALTTAGVKADDRSVQQARALLLKTQQKDGNWALGGANQTFFGTGWAVIGLTNSLPK